MVLTLHLCILLSLYLRGMYRGAGVDMVRRRLGQSAGPEGSARGAAADVIFGGLPRGRTSLLAERMAAGRKAVAEGGGSAVRGARSRGGRARAAGAAGGSGVGLLGVEEEGLVEGLAAAGWDVEAARRLGLLGGAAGAGPESSSAGMGWEAGEDGAELSVEQYGAGWEAQHAEHGREAAEDELPDDDREEWTGTEERGEDDGEEWVEAEGAEGDGELAAVVVRLAELATLGLGCEGQLFPGQARLGTRHAHAACHTQMMHAQHTLWRDRATLCLAALKADAVFVSPPGRVPRRSARRRRPSSRSCPSVCSCERGAVVGWSRIHLRSACGCEAGGGQLPEPGHSGWMLCLPLFLSTAPALFADVRIRDGHRKSSRARCGPPRTAHKHARLQAWLWSVLLCS
jgi:hypothetical protein